MRRLVHLQVVPNNWNECLSLFEFNLGLHSGAWHKRNIRRRKKLTERFFALHKRFLSSKVSTEAVQRDTANEVFVLHSIENKFFLKALFDIEMVEMKKERKIACSPFGLPVLDICCLLRFEGTSILECVEWGKLFLALF